MLQICSHSEASYIFFNLVLVYFYFISLSCGFSTSLLHDRQSLCRRSDRIIYVLQVDSSGHTPRNYFWILFESCLWNGVRGGVTKRASETETRTYKEMEGDGGLVSGRLSVSFLCVIHSLPLFRASDRKLSSDVQNMTSKLYQDKTALRPDCDMEPLRGLLFLLTVHYIIQQNTHLRNLWFLLQ